MKITRNDYEEAKGKLEKIRTRMKSSQDTIKQWEDAEKRYGKPREGDEIVAFILDDGTVEAVTRRIPQVSQ